MIKIILLIVLLLVAAMLVYASMQPDDFRYERSAVINAPVSAIFTKINSPRAFNNWSPFIEMDPDMAITYEGPEAGLGAKQSWEGRKSGVGNMEVIESVPNELVRYRLNFLKPFKATNTGELALVSEGNATRVTWSMFGPNNFIGKIIGIFINCEKMTGELFEKGLATLKKQVEGA